MQLGDEEEQLLLKNDDLQANRELLIDITLTSRLGFIQKVYSIISIQLLFTALFAVFSLNQPAMMEFEATQIQLQVLAAITAIVIMCSLFCYPANARRAPNNYILLSLFTICEGYVVSAICCSIAKEYENGVHLIFMALSMTVLMTFGLTLYACFTKQDFTVYTGLLWSFIICLFLLLVFTLLFPSSVIQIIYSVLAIFLYSLYIIIDTQLIVGNNKRHSLKKDDYILGALILYIDIITLFLELLKYLEMINGKKLK